MKPHLRQQYVIPPEQSAEFVACMEDVLEVYQQPVDPRQPLICMDEQPVQLIKQTRITLPAEPGRPETEDYEYERNGTASLFLFVDPLSGWRRVSVRERRTAVDWAEEVKQLLEEDYPEAECIKLVCDQLNTHKSSAFYRRYEASQARQLTKRIELHHTPKHGSWLNIAESELSVLTRQCLSRRIGEMEELKQETEAWYVERNRQQKAVDWRFTTEEARIRLKRLYPQVKT